MRGRNSGGALVAARRELGIPRIRTSPTSFPRNRLVSFCAVTPWCRLAERLPPATLWRCFQPLFSTSCGSQLGRWRPC